MTTKQKPEPVKHKNVPLYVPEDEKLKEVLYKAIEGYDFTGRPLYLESLENHPESEDRFNILFFSKFKTRSQKSLEKYETADERTKREMLANAANTRIHFDFCSNKHTLVQSYEERRAYYIFASLYSIHKKNNKTYTKQRIGRIKSIYPEIFP